MKMEIFNSDDNFGEDFLELEINDDGSGVVKTDPTTNDDDPTKTNNKVQDDDDLDKNDDEELELLLPSNKSADGDPTNNDINDSSSNLSPTFFSSLVQALKEGGVLELEEIKPEDVKSQDDFYNIMKESIKKSEFSDLNDNQKKYLELLRDGLPEDEVLDHIKTIENYQSISDTDIEDEDATDLRRQIMTINFVNKGIDEKKASKLIDKIFDDGEDVQEAKDALNELKTAETKAIEDRRKEAVKQKKNAEEAEKKARETLDKIAKETKQIIPGLDIPVNVSKTVVKGLTSPVGYNDKNQPLDIIAKYLHENPIEGRFKLGYILTVTDGLKNLSILENKTAKKQVFKEIENILKVKENDGGNLNINTEQDSMWDFKNFKF